MKEDNIIEVGKSLFTIENNFEEVPYLNNNSDDIQDIIKEIEKNTEYIQNNFISSGGGNIVEMNFNKE